MGENIRFSLILIEKRLNFYITLAVPANFVLPKNVSLANDYTMLQEVEIVSTVCLKASQVVEKCVGMTLSKKECLE